MQMIKKILKLLVSTFIYFILLSIALIILFKFIAPPITPYQITEYFRLDTFEKDWVDYEKINPQLFQAIIASEDSHFYQHNGVDWKAVIEAAEFNVKNPKRRKRGASTITMQTAKNTFLWHGRNYFRKIIEIYFAHLIDLVWGKKRVLEVYANVIEWGPGIFGVKAASNYYFKKDPINLSKKECALLAVVLPNPKRWNPAQPSSYIKVRSKNIMRWMNDVSLIE